MRLLVYQLRDGVWFTEILHLLYRKDKLVDYMLKRLFCVRDNERGELKVCSKITTKEYKSISKFFVGDVKREQYVKYELTRVNLQTKDLSFIDWPEGILPQKEYCLSLNATVIYYPDVIVNAFHDIDIVCLR